MKIKSFLLPAVLGLMLAGTMIVGGANFDHWSLQRSIVFIGVLIAFVMALRDRIEFDDDE